MVQAASKILAEGDLGSTPLLHILLHLEQRSLSGTLLLLFVEGESADRILFHDGRPTAGAFVRSESSLVAGLLAACERRAGRYAFFDRDLLADHAQVRGSIDPFALVARVCRTMPRPDLVDPLLARYGQHPMRLQPGRPMHRLQLSDQENAVVDLLRASPASVADLEQLSSLTPSVTRQLLYLLIVTRMVAPYEGRNSLSAGSGGRGSSASRDVATAVNAARSSTGTPPVAASRTSLQTFRKRSLSPQPEPVAGASAPFAPPLTPPSPPSTGTGPSRLVTEENTLAKMRRAEARIQAGRPDAALEIVAELLGAEPSNSRFLGLRAYALIVQARTRGEQTVPPQVTAAIEEALMADGNEPRALYALGLSFVLSGKLSKALHFMRRAAEGDREFLVAAREMRLLEQRLQRAGRTRG